MTLVCFRADAARARREEGRRRFTLMLLALLVPCLTTGCASIRSGSLRPVKEDRDRWAFQSDEPIVPDYGLKGDRSIETLRYAGDIHQPSPWGLHEDKIPPSDPADDR